MTQSFDEWLGINYNEKLDDLTKFLIQDAYEAGEQSLQAEIDCLKVELKGANERALMLLSHKNNMVDKMQAEIDELKQRIDYALTFSATWHKSSGSALALEIIKILKGEE